MESIRYAFLTRLVRSLALGLALCWGASASMVRADVTWPAGQLLPSFPRPAVKQDLIQLHGSASTWQAEGQALGHGTGRADGDGWLCQVGVDAPNKHMIYGPYDTRVPTGGNTARFRMKIDNNTADDNVQATIDVRDNTTGAVLASKEIKRREFSVAGDWVTFSLPFEFNDAGHAIELRVHWPGGAYLKVDYVSIDRGFEDELTLFASLKGVVNLKQPRIFSYEGDAHAEGPYAWLDSLGLERNEVADNWSLITKYKSEIAGIVVWDPAQPHSVNYATTVAGQKRALVASPALVERLTSAPYDFPILLDLRGRFANRLAVYQAMYDELWPSLTHRLLIGLSPQFHKAALREYAVAVGAAVVWLDPMASGESELLDRFLSGLDKGSAYMGWWPEEGAGVERGSRHGVATVASDYATNLTVHGGMPRTVRAKPVPPKPILENKIYVAFILSDGDNLQYVEHLMRKLWNDGARGQVPMGWTVSPAMLDAMPGALDFYHQSGTPNDNLISGPSGWGYGYPNFWPSQEALERFARETDDYTRRAGLRVVTIWNHITGGIDSDVGSSFAKFAPSVLGLTGQNTGGGLTVYEQDMPGFALSCNYCTNEQAIKDHINNAASGWDRSGPRFILIQAQPWQGVTPTSFRNVRDSLNGDFAVVRPDNWFQLLRQSRGIPIEPIDAVQDGVVKLVNRASGKCMSPLGGMVEKSVALVQVECANVDAQRFRVIGTGAGYTKLVPITNEALVVDVEGGPDARGEGPKLSLYDDLNGANQQFQPVWEEGSYYHLLARHSDRCLDVPGGGVEENLQLQQWTCNGLAPQSFRFVGPDWLPGDDEPDAGVADGGPGGDGDGDGTDPGDGDGDGTDPGDGEPASDGGVSGDGDGDGKPGSLPSPAGGCDLSAFAVPGRSLLGSLGLLVLFAMRRRRRA